MNFGTLLLLIPMLNMKQLVVIRSFSGGNSIVYFDGDHDGQIELYLKSIGNHANIFEIWEHMNWNRYRLVYADTGPSSLEPPPYPGMFTGNFRPDDIGDADQDGRTDLLGLNWYMYHDTAQGVTHHVPYLVIMESPAPDSYPTRRSWMKEYEEFGIYDCESRFFGRDMDRDGQEEVFFCDFASWMGSVVLECLGDNRYEMVFKDTSEQVFLYVNYHKPGDIDLDGWRDIVSTHYSFKILVGENSGPDNYRQVLSARIPNCINNYDIFQGRDVNQDGKPEAFVTSAIYRGGNYWQLDLYMMQAVGDNELDYHHIARTIINCDPYQVSDCGDLDGDGIEEVVWSTANGVWVLKPVSQYEFSPVFRWTDLCASETYVRVSDLNRNGYNEIIISGGWTWILEVEAIRLLHPNRRIHLVPGDTCYIRWQVFEPPRCDSVSLFLLVDTVVAGGAVYWVLDTIATGLSPADSVYPWVVPDMSLLYGRVVAIAYGPGWQYDESDSTFAIFGTGIKEGEIISPGAVSLSVEPNPASGFTRVGYLVPVSGDAEVTIVDLAGRQLAQLASGFHHAGFYRLDYQTDLAPGIYFVRLKCPGAHRVAKLVISRGR